MIHLHNFKKNTYTDTQKLIAMAFYESRHRAVVYMGGDIVGYISGLSGKPKRWITPPSSREAFLDDARIHGLKVSDFEEHMIVVVESI